MKGCETHGIRALVSMIPQRWYQAASMHLCSQNELQQANTICLQHHCNTNGHLEELRQEKRIVCTNWNSLFQLNNQANWC